MRLLSIVFLSLVLLVPFARADFSFITSPPLGAYNLSEWQRLVPQAINGTADNAGNSFLIHSVELQINRTGGEYWDGSQWVSTPTTLLATVQPADAALSTFFYAFTPPTDLSRNYSFRSAVIDLAGNHVEDVNTKESQTILFDVELPQTGFTRLPPVWSTSPSVDLSFDASDAISGIQEIQLFYSIYTRAGVLIQASTLEKTFVRGGTYTFIPKAGLTENYTYVFQTVAFDRAGNTVTSNTVSTTFDTQAPECVMQSPPPLVPGTFSLGWIVLENASGTQAIQVQYDDGTGWQDAVSVCAPYGPKSTGTTCTLPDGSYSFRCEGADNAGNVGSPSSPVLAAVDATPPSVWLNPLPEFINRYNFTLSWNGTDLYGISCFGITYGGAMTGFLGIPLLNAQKKSCMNDTPIIFGDGGNNDPKKTQDGWQFFFVVNATDLVGNTAPNSNPINITIDTLVPSLTVTATDQNGNPPTGGVITLTVTSNAVDFPSPPLLSSGIGDHFIFLDITRDGRRIYTQPCPYLSTCSFTQNVQGADQVEYYAVVLDRAGNRNESPHTLFSPHPLANFVTHNVVFPLGSTQTMEVQMRNLGSVNENITLILGSYDLAGFTLATGSFERFNISANARILDVYELPPGGTGTATVELLSTDPLSYTNTLTLDAAASSGLVDQDSMVIAVTFPASFDAWTDWAVLLLVGGSVFLFGVRRRTQK